MHPAGLVTRNAELPIPGAFVALLSGIEHAVTAERYRAGRPAAIGGCIGILGTVIALLPLLDDMISAEWSDTRLQLARMAASVPIPLIAVVTRLSRIDGMVSTGASRHQGSGRLTAGALASLPLRSLLPLDSTDFAAGIIGCAVAETIITFFSRLDDPIAATRR